MIIILGQTSAFWSGVAAGIFFALLMLTCSVNLRCLDGVCSDGKRKKLYGLHKYFIWLSVAAVAIHIILVLLAYVFHIWI